MELPDITFRYFGYYTSKGRFRDGVLTPLRTAKEYEIDFHTIDGGVSYIDGEEYRIKKSRIIVAKPGQTRQSVPPLECYTIHFSVRPSNEAQKAWVEEHLNTLPDMLELYDIEQYFAVFDDMIQTKISSVPGSELLCTAKLFELVSYLERDKARGLTVTNDKYIRYRDAVYKTGEYIRSSFSKRLTLAVLADKAHMSQTYFHTVFKATIGVTPQRYVMNVRLANAKNLLLNTNAGIEEISERCGFDSLSYFSYAFKKETGISPGEFRKQNREVTL